MIDYHEILWLDSLEINKTNIAASCKCSGNTVASALQQVETCDLK